MSNFYDDGIWICELLSASPIFKELKCDFKLALKPNVSTYGTMDLDCQNGAAAKGQLISKCPYEKSVSSKIPMKKFPRFLP